MRHPLLKRNNATTVVLFINLCILLKKCQHICVKLIR